MELGASSEKTEKPVEDERESGPIVVGKGRLRVLHGHWWRQGVKWRDSISGSALVYPHYPGWITAHPNSKANSRASPTPAHGGGITSGKLITIHTGWLATVLFLLPWGRGDTTEYGSSWKGWQMHMGHVLLMKGPSGSSGALTITSESFHLKTQTLSSLPATLEKKKNQKNHNPSLRLLILPFKYKLQLKLLIFPGEYEITGENITASEECNSIKELS